MSFQAFFDNRRFQIEGFDVSTTLTPLQGITGSLYVMLYATHTADPQPKDEELGGELDLSQDWARQPGRLTIKDSVTRDQLQFHDIRLDSVEDGVTRGERFRLLEFSYPRKMRQAPDVDLRSDDDTDKRLSMLGDTYKISINNEKNVYLLGAHSAVLPQPATSAHRFWKLAYKNSFLKKVFEVDETLRRDNPFPEFTIDYDRQRMSINPTTLRAMVVQVSAGMPFVDRHPEPLLYMLGQQQPNILMPRRERSAHEVWIAQAPRDYSVATGHRWLETVTLTFNSGYYLKSGVM